MFSKLNKLIYNTLHYFIHLKVRIQTVFKFFPSYKSWQIKTLNLLCSYFIK